MRTKKHHISPARWTHLWNSKIERYKLIGKELDKADGAYIHWLHMKFNPRFYTGVKNDVKGYQVRITALGNGYSKWFGINQWGSKAEAFKAAALYREFAMSRLPDLFPTKEQFIMWMVKRAEHPAAPVVRLKAKNGRWYNDPIYGESVRLRA